MEISTGVESWIRLWWENILERNNSSNRFEQKGGRNDIRVVTRSTALVPLQVSPGGGSFINGNFVE